MNQSMSVRPYVSADYESVRELYEIPGTFGGQVDIDRDSKKRLDEQSAKDSKSILVAEENGKIVGTVSILADARFAWLVRFAVTNPSAADVLFDEACNILKERGHNQVLVYAPAADSSFETRYTSLEFIKGDDYTCFWKEL
jgi:hypothetical protein